MVDEEGKVDFEREGERLCLINSKVMMMREGNVIFSGLTNVCAELRIRTSEVPAWTLGKDEG